MENIIISMIAIMGVAYLVLAIYLNNHIWKYILKPGTMLLIIFLAVYVSDLQNSFSYYVWIALLFSLAGDVFLMLQDKWFIHGLVSFLAAHIIYILGFVTSLNLFFTYSSGAFIIIVVILAVLFFKILYPQVYQQGGKLFLAAVAIYIVTISTMLSLAILTGSKMMILAAFLFFISDAVLAFNKFCVRFKLADYIVMSTYFSAQLLFAISVGGRL